MIKPYVGWFYVGNIRDEGHLRYADESSELLCGECDICGEVVSDLDYGIILTQDRIEIEDAVIADDGVCVGDHIICGHCHERIKNNEIDIAITKRGETK